MDFGFFFIPQEGYGASNDAKGNFGPPKFDDAGFMVNSESFLEKALIANGFEVLQKYKQDYLEDDGQILIDHIFFAKKGI